MQFKRRPIQYGVHVDGRLMGRPYRSSGVAQTAAEELQHQAPWSLVEVVESFA